MLVLHKVLVLFKKITINTIGDIKVADFCLKKTLLNSLKRKRVRTSFLGN